MVKGKKIFWQLAVIVFYVLALYPVLRSGYMYDDIYNYAAKGYLVYNDTNIIDMTWHFMYTWLQNGRCFIFGFYTYYFFTKVGLLGYKACIVLITLANGIVIKKVIQNHLGKDDPVGLLSIFLFPVIMSLDCTYNSAMYGFHMLVQMAFLWSLLGIMFFQIYLETDKICWQVLSCIFLFISLGTYEVSYALCLIYVVMAFIKKRDIVSVIKRLLPQFLIGVAWVAFNIIARMLSTSEYAGTSVSFGIETWWGFLRQLSGSTTIFNIIKYMDVVEEIGSYSAHSTARYVIVAILLVVLTMLLVKKNENSKNENKGLIIFIGVWFIISPTILIAITERYQQEVTWGKGYLPAYISAWGWAILAATAIRWLYQHGINKYIMVTILTLCSFGIVIPNQKIANYTVNKAGNGFYNEDKLFEAAKGTGIFDSWEENEKIVDLNTVWVEKNIHYSWKMNKKIEAVSVNDLLYMDDTGSWQFSSYYDLIKDASNFWAVSMKNDNILFASECTDLMFQLDENEIKKFADMNYMYVYIPNEAEYTKIKYKTGSGSGQAINIDDLQLFSENGNGKAYVIDVDDVVDMMSVTAE